MQVRILQPAKSAAQSGRARSRIWIIQPLLPTVRAPDPLMGWVSSGDSLSELGGKLQFANLDDAKAFAASQGWEYEIEAPAERVIKPRNYLDNFRTTRPQDEDKSNPTSRSQ